MMKNLIEEIRNIPCAVQNNSVLLHRPNEINEIYETDLHIVDFLLFDIQLFERTENASKILQPKRLWNL